MISAAHAQQDPELGGGVIIIQGGTQPLPPATDPVPSDEELARISIGDELLTLVAQLDSPDFKTREEAMKTIIETPGDNRQLYALLWRSTSSNSGGTREPDLTLSAEQHYRLLGALRERIVEAPRGALGISMNNRAMPGEPMVVEVSDVLPGMPAERVLRVGDRIIAIDGESLTLSTELISRVQSRRPGETLELTVLRQKRDPMNRPVVNERGGQAFERLKITIELGSAENLRDPRTGLQQPPGQILEQRRREAAIVERRFRREVVRLEIEGDLPLAASRN